MPPAMAAMAVVVWVGGGDVGGGVLGVGGESEGRARDVKVERTDRVGRGIAGDDVAGVDTAALGDDSVCGGAMVLVIEIAGGVASASVELVAVSGGGNSTLLVGVYRDDVPSGGRYGAQFLGTSSSPCLPTWRHESSQSFKNAVRY